MKPDSISNTAVIRTYGLKKTYGIGGPHEVEVLRGIDMEVVAGEFVSVIGQSGSGKSTLLNILGALDVQTGGSVFINGIDISALDQDGLADLRNRTIGFVFQANYLLEEFTCLENALMPVTIWKGTPDSKDVARMKDLLRRVELEDQMYKFPPQMSGGQQQRTAIVRALANSPQLILADEPTGNLDSRSGQQVFTLMREMARETGVAFVMVTHDDRLAQAADRILRIEDGFIQEVHIANQPPPIVFLNGRCGSITRPPSATGSE